MPVEDAAQQPTPDRDPDREAAVPVYFLSDSTGISAETMGNALLIQFPDRHFDRRLVPFITTVEHARDVVAELDEVMEGPVTPLVFSTTVVDEIRTELHRTTAPIIDFFEMHMPRVEEILGETGAHVAAQLHGLGDVQRYNARMAAIEYAIEHDDGQSLRALDRADIILLAPSRCGKTPTTMYLALQHGINVANYPLVDHPMCGEIDIMELVGDEPGRIWSSVHGPGYTLSGLTAKYDLPAGQTYHDGFHTFALDWSPSELVFSVDGTVYHRVPRSAIDDNPWVFDQPFFIILNLTVGGSWGGEPAATTTFPAQMVIDHVAVYSAD